MKRKREKVIEAEFSGWMARETDDDGDTEAWALCLGERPTRLVYNWGALFGLEFMDGFRILPDECPTLTNWLRDRAYGGPFELKLSVVLREIPTNELLPAPWEIAEEERAERERKEYREFRARNAERIARDSAELAKCAPARRRRRVVKRTTKPRRARKS